MVKKISNLENALIFGGMLCPVPGLGEVIVGAGLTRVSKAIGIFGKSNVWNYTASVAIAGLMRWELYSILYNPVMNYLEKVLN
jgi:hypothetical protein